MPAVPWEAHLPGGVAAADVDLCPDGNLTRGWCRRWEAAPEQRVLHHPGHGWVRADELEDRTRRVAGRLAAAGLAAGDRVVLSAVASVDLVVAHVAALRLGLVVVPVNGAYREREVAHIVRDARPAAAIVDDRVRGEWIRRASTPPPLVVGTEVGLPDADPGDLDDVDAAHPALLAYTSGTTGAPKGAVLRHGNLVAGAEALRLAWRWEPGDRLLLTLPLFHMHGLGVGLHGSLTAGASVILRSRFDAGDVLATVGAGEASLFFGVPTMYARLASSPSLDRLAGLRLAVSGSAPLPPDLWHAVADRAGQRILERYGMTETVMNLSNPYDGQRRPGTVGLPLPGVEVRLAEADGEVLLRGPNVFDHYWERPEATAAAFDADGWFSTGDLGATDEMGYVRIVGRSKDLIITGGHNVYPREVEEVLRGHPAVVDVAVVGLPSRHWGEEVTAVVVTPDRFDPGQLEAWAAGRLAAHKRPKAYREVEELPRNALGKVLKDEVRRQLAP
jgi:malonyl-CoA/methylmalonyl-CoA synthetase